ncbi:branched-chain amino acid ABC transporter permease [Halorussus gelatinilyticus]|uniref:Branched-chain amino acid ABC transporter permease n=1 Tax=Halorussus gelatinilyticus TaxID=2937524 RepID=A0A8U0IH34_9EURY|nr:branched-chain amino acid ABC transporter permease [Halorussus gelatinilyticus]UPV99613.1 branched-chain amino acid ABC transporter permease [Halorussus gelatinilyticus]
MSDEPTETPDAAEETGSVVDRTQRELPSWERVRESELFVVGATTVAVAVFPWLFSRAPVVSGVFRGYQDLATLILIWGIFAMGFNLLLGYTGLLSFGHAAFWGGAAYAAGVFSAQVSSSPILVILAGTSFAALSAWILGFISLRRGGIYFAILTLAFGQMAYYMALSPLAWITGGENGFTGVRIGALFGVFDLRYPVPMLDWLLGTWKYVLVGGVAVLCVAVANRILHSPYGMVFRAIRENDQRAEFVGLNVWRYKLMAFVISGAFAGVAGSLYTIYSAYVPLSSFYWTTSGEVVIMAVLGGVGSLFGPILGAGIYLYVENIVSGIQQLTLPFTGPNEWLTLVEEPVVLLDGFGAYWHLILGLVFVGVVVLFPRGIWGLLQDLGGALRRLGGSAVNRLGGGR